MDLTTFLVQCLNALQYGLLLFLVASGMTLIFGIRGLINLAHGSSYMIGAYMACAVAPLIVAEIWRVVGEIRAAGIATLIVDRDYHKVLARSDHALVLQKGRVVLSGRSADVAASPELAGFLGV